MGQSTGFRRGIKRVADFPNSKWTVESSCFPIYIFRDEDGDPTKPYYLKNDKFVLLENMHPSIFDRIKWFFKKKIMR